MCHTLVYKALQSRFLLEEQARTIAEMNGTSDFKSTRGWLNRFLRRTGTQGSPLWERRRSQIRWPRWTYAGTKRNFVQIWCEQYLQWGRIWLDLSHGSSRSYLVPKESLSIVRGTEFQKHIDRITTVYCVNSVSTHKFPKYYIGKSEVPKCFRYFPELKNRFSSQTKC